MENNKVIGVMVALAILSVACMGILVMLDTPIRESLIGPEGPQGIQGDLGVQGPQGAKGDPGEDGEVARWLARLDALNLTFIQDFTQTIAFNISAGTERTWEFLILEYGIIWEAKITFSGEYVSMSHSWSREGERFFVGSSGRSLTYTGSADIVYYGRQDYLWGTITVDYFLADRDPNRLWINSMIMTNLPTVTRGGDAYIDIS